MITSPNNKGPIGSMPESTEEEDDKGIPHFHPGAALAASQRNVHVIPEPGG